MKKRIYRALIVAAMFAELSLSVTVQNDSVQLPIQTEKVSVEIEDNNLSNTTSIDSHEYNTVSDVISTEAILNTEIVSSTETNCIEKDQAEDSYQKINKAKTNAITDSANTTEQTETEKTQQKETSPQIYKYCPTSINGTVLYCSNEANPGEVKDGIYLGGAKVLSTSVGSWDSAQVCDPSVISGNFTFNGCNYVYLMAYLGCTTYNSTNNEVGFAVSNDLCNWIKVGKIVNCAGDGFWGVGQPSLLNINNDGLVYLFYTSGTASKTTTYVQYLNCNDLNNIQCLGQSEITTAYDFISNADFAYNNADSCLYMTCDTHPFGGTSLNFISDKQTIYKMSWDRTIEGFGSQNWQIETTVGVENTGYAKNHNACFARDGYGNLSGRTMYVSIASEVGDFMANLCTYNFVKVEF